MPPAWSDPPSSRPLLLLLLLAAHAAAQPAPLPAELSDPTLCEASGFPDGDVSAFVQRLDLGASPYGKTSSAPLFMPLYSSHALGGAGAAPDVGVTTAAIFLHGLSAAANSYFCTGFASARGRGALVLAPWHGDTQVNSSYWARPGEAPPAGDEEAWSAYWTTSRWMTGGNISPGETSAAQYTTSFDIIDGLIRNVTTSGLFPNLQLVSVIGFSAGSQFTSRWAFGSPVGAADAAVRAETSGGLPVRLFISDPGTFLYLDDTRPAPSCRPLRDTGPGAAPCASFVRPADAEIADCADTWNAYKFGIDGGFSYLDAYMAVYDTNATAKALALARLGTKDIRLIFGDADTCNCNFPGYANGAYCFPTPELSCLPDANGGAGCCDTWPDATTSNAMDAGCEAMVQGSNRLQRGQLYVQHLNNIFPARALGPFVAETVAGMGHNNSGLYAYQGFINAAYWSGAGGSSGNAAAGNAAAAGAVYSVEGAAVGAAVVATAAAAARLRASSTGQFAALPAGELQDGSGSGSGGGSDERKSLLQKARG